MAQRYQRFFDFDGIRFFPETSELVSLSGGETRPLREKEAQLLETLIANAGKSVSKKEISEKIWGKTSGFEDLSQTITQTKYTLVQKIKRMQQTKNLIVIESEGKDGYRFTAPFQEGRLELRENEFDSPAEESEDGLPKEETVENDLKIQSIPLSNLKVAKSPNNLSFILSAATLYALLYVVALFLELAYRVDEYATFLAVAAPVVFVWMFSVSAMILLRGWDLTRHGKTGVGGGFLAFGFVGNCLVLYLGLSFFLPATAVTEMDFSSQTASAALLKNFIYFLFLAGFFLLIPFHYVAALQHEIETGSRKKAVLNRKMLIAPRGAILLKPFWLGFILLATLIVSFIATMDLLTHLKPSPYQNLFTQLILLRGLLYFSLAGFCLLWYTHQINLCKRNNYSI